jgi:hypothetical protein
MRIPRIPFSEVLHFTEVAAIVAGTIFAGYQMRELRLQNSADLSLRVGEELNSPINESLSDALDSDPSKSILKPPDGTGEFTVEQLDDYLGEYETLADLYQNHLITCPMMYNEFSGDLEDAYKNKNVMAHIAEERRDDPTVWVGFLDLGNRFDNGYRCQ